MDNKIIGITLAVFVGVLLVGGVLLPVVDSATSTEKIFKNDGYYHMSKYETDTAITVEWNYTAPDKIVVNGVSYSIPTGGPYSVVASDVAIRSDGTTFCQVITEYQTSAAMVSESATLNVTFIDGTMTVTEFNNGESLTPYTKPYTSIYVIDDSGPYVMKKSTESAYLTGDSEFFGCGITNIFGNNMMLNVSGSIDDGATVTQITTANQLTYSDIVVNSQSVDKYNGLYEISDIVFTASDGENTQEVTYSYFIVPYKVAVSVDPPITGASSTLLATLPIIALLALISMVLIRTRY